MARLTAEQKDEIVDAYANGEKASAIAQRFGICDAYPPQIAKRRGVVRERHSIRRQEVTAAQ